MIAFNFSIRNPFSDRWNTIYYKDQLFGKHKSGEIQVIKDNTVIALSFCFTTRTDHAGVDLDLGLLGYTVMLACRDTRHWDEETDTWKVYD